MVDMVHYDDIAQALRLVCQGAVALRMDTDGSDAVTVGSNELFSRGDTVALRDNLGHEEAHVITDFIGLTQVVLEATVLGNFAVSGGARLQIVNESEEELKWVAVGRPEALPMPAKLEFPAVVVEPGVMKQPANAGSNCTYQQEYTFNVYYLERWEEGADADMAAIKSAAKIFNRISSDPYLGDSCYYSQIVEFEPACSAEKVLRGKDLPLRIVRMEVHAQRAELWT